MSTTAPAPSPNSTQVVRSLQSTMRVSVSEPITRAVFTEPEAMNFSATLSAKMKPEQAALTSNAGQPAAPRRACTRQAVDGKMRSGVVVPTTISSISEASTPAASSARTAAWKARSPVVSPSAATCRWRMPVRAAIHSSEVSTIFARSSLVRTLAGR